MSANFPAAPALNQVYSYGGNTWRWNGRYWQAETVAEIAGATGATGSPGATGATGPTGLGFSIVKTYASIAALTADTAPTGILAGQFAIIDNGNYSTDSENSRLYLWNGTSYQYVTDLSGAQGIQGPAGATGIQGNVGLTGATGIAGNIGATGPAGTSANITIQDEGSTLTSAVTAINFTGPGVTATASGSNVTVTVNATGTGTSSNFTFSNTAPVTASPGDRWINSETLIQLTYINDGDTAQWVETVTRSSAGANRDLSNLNAPTTINTSLIPNSNVTHDLGSSSLRWRDLYLSGNTIDLGGTAIKSSATGVSFANTANAQQTVGLTVSSIQIASAGNVVTLQAGAGGLQTVSGSGNVAPVIGATGATGPAGTAGTAGTPGSAGPTGATGLTGATGAPGSAAAIYDVNTASSGYFDLPTGNTAQRPVSPGSGMIRFNSQTGYGEIYNAGIGQWLQFGTSPLLDVEYLVVAGGGGGGGLYVGGGGGGGGYRVGTLTQLATNSALTVTVGGGGTGAGSGSQVRGGNGSDSVFNTITSTGGGGGGSYSGSPNGLNGGSGGGAAYLGSAGAGNTPATTPSQGNNGGGSGSLPNQGGGGGGAGGAGSSTAGTSSTSGPKGGDGIQNSITGVAVYYAGGGGGGGDQYGGQGGLGNTNGYGGGGNSGGQGAPGPSSGASSGGSASSNTGGGGGGAGGNVGSLSSGSGGSGIIILKYLAGYTATFSAGLVVSTVTASGYKISNVSAGTGTVTFTVG